MRAEKGLRKMTGTDRIAYRNLRKEEITRELFRQFIRRQEVGKCWRRVNGEWVIKDDPFVDDWSEADYEELVACLKNTLAAGGFVYAAFCDDALKGFVSVEAAHSAVESQAFYKAMGCVEAQVYHPGHVEAEPYDCQLECAL